MFYYKGTVVYFFWVLNFVVVMLLIVWVAIGVALNFITITRVCNKYYNNEDCSIALPIVFYINFLFSPFILGYNLYFLAIAKNTQNIQIVKIDGK